MLENHNWQNKPDSHSTFMPTRNFKYSNTLYKCQSCIRLKINQKIVFNLFTLGLLNLLRGTAVLNHVSLKQINMDDNHICNHMIEEYFHLGFNYKEIIDCLFLNNEILLSHENLKESLRKKISDDHTSATLMR